MPYATSPGWSGLTYLRAQEVSRPAICRTRYHSSPSASPTTKSSASHAVWLLEGKSHQHSLTAISDGTLPGPATDCTVSLWFLHYSKLLTTSESARMMNQLHILPRTCFTDVLIFASRNTHLSEKRFRVALRMRRCTANRHLRMRFQAVSHNDSSSQPARTHGSPIESVPDSKPTQSYSLLRLHLLAEGAERSLHRAANHRRR